MPNANISHTLRRAVDLHQSGLLAPAAALYQEVLSQDRDNVEALHYLGLIRLQQERPDQAAPLLLRAAVLSPSQPSIHKNLGSASSNLGQMEAAVACFNRALALQPNDSVALGNLGLALTHLGGLDEALACLKKALALQPDAANAYNCLGELFRRRRQHEAAIDAYRRTLLLKRNFVLALNNLGTALTLTERFDEALRCFERALSLQPEFADGYNNLGGLLSLRGEIGPTLASFRRALSLQPGRPDIHSNLILLSQYLNGDDVPAIKAEQRRWNDQHAAPVAPSLRPWINDPTPERPLRIGYVSADLRDHVVGRNLLPLFEHHDRSKFEIYCYAQVPAPDALTARFRAAAAHWRDIAPLFDPQLAELIRKDRIDLLVDLSLHTAKNRLLVFAYKPAPVQLSFGGYPGGTGLNTIDYHLTDPFLEPGTGIGGCQSDVPFHLPHSFWCYEALSVDAPVGPLPAKINGFVTFGCLNNFCKVADVTVDLWARTLIATPEARLLLLVPEGTTRERIISAFRAAGLDAGRVMFFGRQSRERYLKLYDRIDVGLDTFPYNGHTTSLDSYWMGVPVVTLVGKTPVSRAGWSQLSNLGLTELAAHSPEEFVGIAARMAGNPANLATLRAGLRERMRRSPLMDGAGFARGIEDAYRAMWRRWCAEASRADGQKNHGPAG